MNVKRYFANTAREALRALKADLGADAIVLSNRAVDGGVEILALPAEAVGAIDSASASPKAPEPVAARDDDDDYRVQLSGARGWQERATTFSGTDRPAPAVIRPFAPPRMDTPDYLIRNREDGGEINLPGSPPDSPVAAKAPAPAPVPAPAEVEREPRNPEPAMSEDRPMTHDRRHEDERIRDLQETNARLMSELGGIRGMIERQLAGFAWGETLRNAPGRAEIVGELLESGFSGVLARKLAESVGDDIGLQDARAIVRNALSRDLRAMSSDADLIEQGGVYALVGPTGVGKTTTTAKIAARCVVRHGADKLALITTDGYRIGAQEQLRIYGRILGVPVFPVRDAADLRQTLAELRNKHMVLIDTVGVSQRDEMVARQAAMLNGAGCVRRLLLLNSTCSGDTLDDVIRAYRGPDLSGCVLTKVDEAASLAPVLGAAISHELEVFYVTNGQRVPEDLHLPNRAYLLHRSLRARSEDSPWKLRSEEAAVLMAAGGER